MQILTTGIVIKEIAVNDDKYLHILTEDLGVISAFAKGAKKLKGKLTATSELFCYSQMSIFSYKDSYTLDNAECEDSFFELRNDLESLALSSYFAQLCDDMAPREEPARQVLHLFLNALHLIRGKKKPYALIKAAFELKILTLSGFMPNLLQCASCGNQNDEKMCFSIKDSVLYCVDCNAKENQNALLLPVAILAAMRHIAYCETKKAFSFSLSKEGLDVLEDVSERYLLSQTERSFKALEFYKTIKNM